MFTKQTIRDIDLNGKTVLLRAELDAPLDEAGHKVVSDFRLKRNLPTLQYLLDKKCKIVIIGKVGRPKGPDPTMSTAPAADRLEKLLRHSIKFVGKCVGQEVKTATADLKPGEIVMLENVRWHAEEDNEDEKFAQAIVADTGAQIFVQDCFASVHHAAVTINVIPKFLPSVAGLSLESEVDTITEAMERPARPLMAIIGGAKISGDKLEILQRFIQMADFVAIGGAMAVPFLVANNIDIGDSLYNKADLPVAKDILRRVAEQSKKRRFVFAIPHDGVVADQIDKTSPTRIVEWTTHTMADIQHYPKRVPAHASKLYAHEKILDIGPFSASFIAGGVQLANTVIWSGAMGVTETEGLQGPTGPTAHGTQTVIEALLGDLGHKPYTLVGGGDTVGYLEQRKLIEYFDHVSSGGGASLELMAGRKLPGVEALRDKK